VPVEEFVMTAFNDGPQTNCGEAPKLEVDPMPAVVPGKVSVKPLLLLS
jgi:hypothetical protein